VSSPGPPVDDYEDPPYTIPPGPYPDEKPELSYAALVGQAILSSKEHRLSLQHIYQWISIVYPFFKRSDQTWMNSIRHVLSTTTVFRKELRGPSKSQWTIWDQDLPCFANGGFDRKLCADMNRRKPKAGPSKRKAEDMAGLAAKRSRNDSPTLVLPFQPGPTFPHVHSNPHLQPYYSLYSFNEPRMEKPTPLLPPPFGTPMPAPMHMNVPPENDQATPSKTVAPLPSSASQVPSLTPNLSSSSSPPLASRDTSFQSTDADGIPSIQDPDSNDIDTSPIEALEPSVTLLKQDTQDAKLSRARTKGKTHAKVP
jgi:Forkhead domain